MQGRPLTPREWAAISPGLRQVLEDAGATPIIVPRASILARFAALWRGRAPIMVLGRTIYWPGAPDEIEGARPLSILQHELQHVLEYRTGELSAFGYAIAPRNWTYAYQLTETTRWSDLGAEQRAQLVQDYWLAGRGLLPDAPPLGLFRKVIPWER